MQIHGITVEGHIFNHSSGLSTCGTAVLSSLRNSYTETDNEKILADIFKAIQWSSGQKKHGTLVFSLSSNQIRGRYGFMKFLCEHLNTKCVHWYTNDAHGPNMVFLCIHHYDEKQTLPREQPQLMNVFKKTTFNNGSWKMESKKEQ